MNKTWYDAGNQGKRKISLNNGEKEYIKKGVTKGRKEEKKTRLR